MSISRRLKRSLYWPFLFTVLVWLVFFLETALGANWYQLGIYPRETESLPGIIFSPLLHGDIGHLLSNTPPLFTLLVLLFFFYPRVAPSVFITTYLLTGAAVWTLGREVWHIGASGVVYALAMYLAWNGVVRRNLKAIVIALLVLFYYGGMVVGILPGQPGVSWESHLLGALVGVLTAYIFKDKIEQDEQRRPPSWELEPPREKETFLDPETFRKTKREREMEAFWRKMDGRQ